MLGPTSERHATSSSQACQAHGGQAAQAAGSCLGSVSSHQVVRQDALAVRQVDQPACKHTCKGKSWGQRAGGKGVKPAGKAPQSTVAGTPRHTTPLLKSLHAGNRALSCHSLSVSMPLLAPPTSVWVREGHVPGVVMCHVSPQYAVSQGSTCMHRAALEMSPLQPAAP